MISWVAPSFCGCFYTFFYLKIFQSYLVFSYPGPFQHQLFLQGVLVPFTGMIFKFQVLRVKCGYCYWEVIVSSHLPPTPEQTWEMDVYVITHEYTQLFISVTIHLCVYIYIYILKENWVHSDMFYSNLTWQFILFFLIFISNIFLCQWETWFLWTKDSIFAYLFWPSMNIKCF